MFNQKKSRNTYGIIGVVIIIVIVIGFWAIDYFALFQKTPEQSSATPQLSTETTPPVLYDLETVASNLFVPWSIVFTSESRMLVSERNGNIRIIENETLLQQPLGQFTVSQKSEEGLMGMAIDPEYATTRKIFACLASKTENGLYNSVVSFTDEKNSINDIETIINTIPAAQYHAGCRLLFLPDNTLLITTGDATNKNLAQDLNSLAGKTLRINRDGSFPTDNPFPNSPVWSYGHRNSQGLAFDKKNNIIWSSEHGPSIIDGPAGGDEINHIEKGKNYGWPIIHHTETKTGLESPILEFTPAIAPAGMLFYTGTTYPQFTNKLLVTALKGEGIYEITIDQKNPSVISGFIKNKEISVGRIRDIVQAPDGSIYFATSNQDGRGKKNNGDDKIIKLVPRQ